MISIRSDTLNLYEFCSEWLRIELEGRLKEHEGLPKHMMVDLGSNFYANATM